ncbi:ATP-binding cassette domain-containing protein [Vibrio hepatarius]|uniref:ATP-binding cassette domain-containing protein n=1 Tax=Vibrio hepatarius TaxID=171383 RepID=UPI001C088950|nr:ATP-binding cassette domain-containing protein [Vibrio hepatarius]MBU2895680.1 ATP-binding cassette domain-containing protein [Vibrio hepatarius]
MNRVDLDLIKGYLQEQGVGIQSENYQPKRKTAHRQVVKELIELNEHPLIKVDIVDVDVESDTTIPSAFIAIHNEKVHLVRKSGVDEFIVEGGGELPPFASSECFAVRVGFRYVEAAKIPQMLIKRTPPVSLLLLVLVAFVMASPVYSNLFNSRLVFGESVSSLVVVSAIFVMIFLVEFFIKEWIMAELNRRIEAESRIAEDVFFTKVVNSRQKDAIVHWKTATESTVAIWKSAGHIGLDALTAAVIIIAFIFMLGVNAIFPITVYVVFFIVLLTMKMKAYRKIMILNQLKDQKLTYLIGMEKGKRFFKFLNRERIRKRWMSMTNDVSVFNIQIQDHEEKSSGVLKFYSSTSIVVIFVAAYFAIQAGDLQQSAVIALMLLNGRCSGAISALSNRLYQAIIAHSKMKGAIASLHEEYEPSMFEVGVMYTPTDDIKNTLSAENISVVYDEHAVFSGIDLSVSEGMSLAVIGPAGSGKSSLLKVLAGYMPPSGGCVFFNNVAPSEYDSNFFKEIVSYYSPEDRFVADTLGFNASLKFGANIKNFFELLRGFGANFVLNQHAIHGESVECLNLSSGQYQIVKMICSLGNNPELIIMDEPCSHLSPVEAQRFMQRLRERFPKAIIIYSSHSVMLTKQANLILDMNRKVLSVNKAK